MNGKSFLKTKSMGVVFDRMTEEREIDEGLPRPV